MRASLIGALDAGASFAFVAMNAACPTTKRERRNARRLREWRGMR